MKLTAAAKPRAVSFIFFPDRILDGFIILCQFHTWNHQPVSFFDAKKSENNSDIFSPVSLETVPQYKKKSEVFAETLLMVNFGQKTAIFDPWNFAQKKKNHQNHLKPPWNLVSFTKTDKLETWNHFWFHENWLIFKSWPKIKIWSLELARFQNENKDRLHSEDALIFAKGDEIWIFSSF